MYWEENSSCHPMTFIWEENSSCHPMTFLSEENSLCHPMTFLREEKSLCHPMTFISFAYFFEKKIAHAILWHILISWARCQNVFFCELWAFGYILLRFCRKIDEVSLPQKLLAPADLNTVWEFHRNDTFG